MAESGFRKDVGITWDNYLRVRIMVDVNEPLVIGFKSNKGGNQVWISLKHELLGDFYYLCGYLDHVDYNCPRGDEGPVLDKKGNPLFGPWLRAGPGRQNKGLRINLGGRGDGLTTSSHGNRDEFGGKR